jgi:aspartyl protease family protein
MKRYRLLASMGFGLLAASGAGATDVTVAGLFTNKALVQIDGGPLRTLVVGQKTAEGVVLLSVDSDTATFDVDGQRVKLGLGHVRTGGSSSPIEQAVLTADLQGHFFTEGQVNGTPIRFVVDTGSTYVAIPAGQARRLALDYRKGEKTTLATANGNVPAYLIRLDMLRVGNVTVQGVDAVVIEGDGFANPLLGMSFLNRMNMKREGSVMTLTKRY